MSLTKARSAAAQLPMPGMPEPVGSHPIANCWSVGPGAIVMYLGNVSGGPRYGSRGIVKQILRRKAVVDLGRAGTWHIPYFFLGLPQAA